MKPTDNGGGMVRCRFNAQQDLGENFDIKRNGDNKYNGGEMAYLSDFMLILKENKYVLHVSTWSISFARCQLDSVRG